MVRILWVCAPSLSFPRLPALLRHLFPLVLLLASSCALGALPAEAQSFRATTGRNHPEIDWRVAETEHFEIVYPARLSGIEAKAAPIAEESYDALSENLGIAPEEKFTIYLSDQDEVANGFAVPLGGGYTQIWVHVNEFATTWTGRAKWLRKVIAHELAHLFHYRAVESDLGLPGIPLATPSFWTEGLAQYETETWNAQRGDRWLRTAVLADELSYEDGRSIRNGRLRYAVGNSQVRYLAAARGDSTIRKILAHRDTSGIFGLEGYTFRSAFEDVTGEDYETFYEDWRRHVNVYYNSLAGRLPAADSLIADSVAAPLEGTPGRYLYDLQPAPRPKGEADRSSPRGRSTPRGGAGTSAADSGRVAVLSVISPTRPLRRLYVLDRETGEAKPVAEGAIKAPVSWSRDGDSLFFARTTRGEHGALVNDLFATNAGGDVGDAERLTHSRRAAAPAPRPGRPDQIAFVGAKGPAANLFLLNRRTGEERRLTAFTGDVQISALTWRPTGGPGVSDTLAFARFTDAGVRDIALLDVGSERVTSITTPRPKGEADRSSPRGERTLRGAPGEDHRVPVFSPGGDRLAYTTFRDDVPNIFIYDLTDGDHRRVTNLAEGATAYGWLAPDSTHPRGRLAAVTAEGKARDRALLLDATHATPDTGNASAPPGFSQWTTARPPQQIPTRIAVDASLVESRRAYSARDNLTHVISGGFPYYAGSRGYGLAAGSVWYEPLGTHAFFGGGGLAVDDPAESFFYGEYRNNQLRPALSLTAKRLPREPQGYGRSGSSFEETTSALQFEADWPVDTWPRPYTETELETEIELADYRPRDTGDLDLAGTGLPPPEEGQELRFELALERKRLPPYARNLVHPLDGHGWRLQLSGAPAVLGTDSQFLRLGAAAFQLLPGLFGRHRLYLYGHAQAQTGDPLAQNVLGLRRTDTEDFRLPPFFYLNVPENERVRGYRSYALGNRVAFGTAEYRVPVASGLQTEVLGLARLGATSAALFADGGLVWNGATPTARRLGLGAELKNEVILAGGALRVGHALGVAQPADRLGTYDERGTDYRAYYRVQAAVPF
jgi:hypothetical protein